jgi:hypothetical protein
VSFQQDLNFKDLPILIGVCPIPGLDEDELFDAGYLNTAYYFRGISRFNSSFFGWTGHQNHNTRNFKFEGKRYN